MSESWMNMASGRKTPHPRATDARSRGIKFPISLRSPSPQTPHPRATDARSRGIKFPISDMALYAHGL